jgi:hypothetical protein
VKCPLMVSVRNDNCERSRNFIKKDKAINVAGRGGQYVSDTSRIPYFPDSSLIDGSEVVILMHLPRLTIQEDSWYLFLLEAESIPGP